MKSGTPPIRIRTARLTDAEAIESLYQQLHEDDYISPGKSKFRRGLQRALSHVDERFFVAVVGKKLVGAMHIILFRHLGRALRPMAIVENVIVDQSKRRLGIGRRLLETAVRYARSKDCYKVALTSNRKRAHAHRFYRRIGWQQSSLGFTFSLIEK